MCACARALGARAGCWHEGARGVCRNGKCVRRGKLARALHVHGVCGGCVRVGRTRAGCGGVQTRILRGVRKHENMHLRAIR